MVVSEKLIATLKLAAGLLLAMAVVAASEFGALRLAHDFGGALIVWPPEAISLVPPHPST